MTQNQLQNLYRAKNGKQARGKETHHPGYLSSQDTYYVGSDKGIGRILSIPRPIDTYCKVSFVMLHDRKNFIMDGDLLNDRVILSRSPNRKSFPCCAQIDRQGNPEYCGKREHHEYQLCMTIEDIDHTKTKAKSPQTKLLANEKFIEYNELKGYFQVSD
ncbi:hypothetical protein D2V08_12930 [Flagellimonas lutimaris]|uniref:Uncharacterized protein n=1 Tax=Flagellimonas lutimaris TaxID=475082 RepID=A0A3A1NAS7_9FLAO|nr:hypothetical protein [Allomuricauda lutimaris]RIV31656.1 hypothetical protein D2V08_12930 [Allomuricauda lutimaris]